LYGQLIYVLIIHNILKNTRTCNIILEKFRIRNLKNGNKIIYQLKPPAPLQAILGVAAPYTDNSKVS